MALVKIAAFVAAPIFVGVGFLYYKTNIFTKLKEVLTTQKAVNEVKACHLSASLLQSF
jgi:hypothetical protein